LKPVTYAHPLVVMNKNIFAHNQGRPQATL
jgi:hypothetical protein